MKKAIWTWFWRKMKYLKNDDNVVEITGWRSAIVEDKAGGRKHVWYCPWGLK